MKGILSSKFLPVSLPNTVENHAITPSHGDLTSAYSISVSSLLIHIASHPRENSERTQTGMPVTLQVGWVLCWGSVALGLSLTTCLNKPLVILSLARRGLVYTCVWCGDTETEKSCHVQPYASTGKFVYQDNVCKPVTKDI